MNNRSGKPANRYAIGGIVFVGCMFVGMGIGAALDAKQAGLQIGMGVGFVAMALSWWLVK